MAEPRFNVGDRVHYHPVLGRPHDGRAYEVREVGELPQVDHLKRSGAAGRRVYWLAGKAGCVAEEALSVAAEPLPVASLGTPELEARRRQPLDVSVYQGRLVISIGVETLATAARNAPNLEIVNANNDFVGPTITDPDVFAEEVRQALEKAKEDGTTPVHELLDAAFETAIDDGSQVAFMADEEVDDVD